MQSFQIIINGCVCNEYVAALFAKGLEAHWGSIRQFKSRRMTSIWCEVSHRRQSSGCEDVMGLQGMNRSASNFSCQATHADFSEAFLWNKRLVRRSPLSVGKTAPKHNYDDAMGQIRTGERRSNNSVLVLIVSFLGKQISIGCHGEREQVKQNKKTTSNRRR